MVEYKVRGASDDLILISSDMGYVDELDALSQRHIHVYDMTGSHIMIIYAGYDRRGCWSFAVSVVDEDKPISPIIHSVSVDLKTDISYSTGLTILSKEPLEFILSE